MVDAKHKHTLVIGGTRGMGRTLVWTLATSGHDVSVISRRPPDESDMASLKVDHWALDVSDKDKLTKALSEIIQQKGKLQSLVFFQRYRGDGDAWEAEFQTSLTATMNTVEWLTDEFEAGEDNSIVVVGSVASEFVAEEQPLSYHVAKAGLAQLVRYYAVLLGRKGIRVNSVSPGSVIKEESREFYLQNKELTDLYTAITPLGRMGTAEEVANVVAFLGSSNASFITGQNIVVDGGVSLQWHETMARKLTSLDRLNVVRGA